MTMLKEKLSIFYLVWLIAYTPGFAQFAFEYEHHIPVVKDGDTLKMPWAGGINAGVYNTLDINGDGLDDLVVFDRTSGQVMTFVNENGNYTSQPVYASLFPEIRNWMLLLDYNRDGKKDIFTGSGRQGISVYVNTTEEEKTVSWKLVSDPLRTLGFSGNPVALQVGASDTPGISDTDGDGDFDIIIINVNGDGGLNYYQNQSIEKYGHSDSLIFKATHRRWGGVQECGCDQFVFDSQTCDEVYGARVLHTDKEQHVGGKSILAVDMDGDDDKDLITGHEDCSTLYFMENIGTAALPRFESYSSQFPENTKPVDFFVYPAAFYEDIDLDGVKDLIVTPNASYNIANQIDFTASNWLYKNTGTAASPSFSFVSQSLLQDEMIEVGENAAPALVDFDQDGDMDLFIGSRGLMHSDGFYASIVLYKNTGTADNPAFTLATNDFASVSQLKLQELKVYFSDLNNDGLSEMIITGSASGFRDGSIYVFENSEARPFQFDASKAKAIAFDFSTKDNFAFYDIDADGEKDLLLGKETGDLEYYRNEGKNLNPVWVLEDKNIGGITPGIFNLFLSPLLYDLDENGAPDLISTDISGRVMVRPDFISRFSQSQAINVDTARIANSPVENSLLQFGGQTWLAAADLFGDNSTVLLVGGRGGGISIVKLDDQKHEQEFAELLIYPNPSYFLNQKVRVKSEEPIKAIQVISLTGQVVYENEWSEANAQVELIHTLPVGMYLIRVFSVNGNIQTGKLIMSHR